MQSHNLNNLPQLDLIQTLNCQNDISNLDPDLNILVSVISNIIQLMSFEMIL